MKYVIYERPAVEDKYYDDYNWQRHKGPFDDKSQARNEVPSQGSPLAQEYIYTIIPYEDNENIKNSVDDSEKRQRNRKLD